jgi:Porin PorA
MARARNTIGNILVLAGIGMVIFALLWWGIAIRRIAVFPSGFDLATPCEGTVTKLAGKHGMLMLSPAQKEDFKLDRSLSSLDGDYRSDIAAVRETIKSEGQAPFGLNLGQQNVYVMNRRSCENVESSMSTTLGEVVDRSGSWYVNFPFGVKKESRNIFDNYVGSSFSAQYARRSRTNGVVTYLFRGSHGFRPLLGYVAESMGLPTQTTFGELKAELLAMGLPVDELVRNASPGLTPEEREAFAQFPDSRVISLNYTAKTEWEAQVEPVTGTVVDVRNSVTHIYVNTDVRTFLPLLEILANRSEDPAVLQYLSQVDQQKLTEPKELYRIEYRWTAEGVRNATDYAGPRVAPMRFVTRYMMTMMLLLGAACFVVGFVIRRKEHHASTGRASTDNGKAPGDEEGS